MSKATWAKEKVRVMQLIRIRHELDMASGERLDELRSQLTEIEQYLMDRGWKNEETTDELILQAGLDPQHVIYALGEISRRYAA